MVYNGKVVPKTHIIDLINDGMVSRKHAPVGIDLFYKTLAEINLPEGLLANDNRKY